jgi:glycosyltransferase involved in cell wall biosynthesis
MFKKLLSFSLGIKKFLIIEKEPLVSVILPSYNYENFISLAINSVLNQSYKNIELIIVDDCSKDNSPKIVANFAKKYPEKIVFLQNKQNLGICATYEKAIKKAKGKYIAFIDSDDEWRKDNLKFKISVLEQKNDVVLVYSRFSNKKNVISKKDVSFFPARIFNKSKYLFYRPCIYSFSLVVVRADALKSLRFDLKKEYFIVTDWWFFSQLSLKGAFSKIQMDLVYKREHLESFSKKFFSKNKKNNFFSEFRAYLIKELLGGNKVIYLLFPLFFISRKIRELAFSLLKIFRKEKNL